MTEVQVIDLPYKISSSESGNQDNTNAQQSSTNIKYKQIYASKQTK